MFKLNKGITALILALSLGTNKIDLPLQSKAYAQEKLEDKIINVKIKQNLYKVEADYGITLNGKNVENQEEILKVIELAKLVEEARKVESYKIDLFGLWDLEALKYSAFIRKGQALTIKYDDHIKWALSFPIKFLDYAFSGTLDIPGEAKAYILKGMKKFLESPQDNLKNYTFTLYNNSNLKLEENRTLIRKISPGNIDEETADKIKDNSNYVEIFGNAALEYYKELQKYDTLEKRWFQELIPVIGKILESEYERLPKESIGYLEKTFLSKLRNYPPNKRFEELIEENRNNLIKKRSKYLNTLNELAKEYISPEEVIKRFINYACENRFNDAFNLIDSKIKTLVEEDFKKAIQRNRSQRDERLCKGSYQVIHRQDYKDFSIIFLRDDEGLRPYVLKKNKSKWKFLGDASIKNLETIKEESLQLLKELDEIYDKIIIEPIKKN